MNNAPFEWIQHEPIGRTEGLTTGQLYAIRDAQTPLPPFAGLFTDLQVVALEFTDAVTRTDGLSALASSLDGDTSGRFTIDLGKKYKQELKKWLDANGKAVGGQAAEDATEDLYAEASLVVSTYNMVSRFLVSTDVQGLTGVGLPWPLERHEVRHSHVPIALLLIIFLSLISLSRHFHRPPP